MPAAERTETTDHSLQIVKDSMVTAQETSPRISIGVRIALAGRPRNKYLIGGSSRGEWR